MSKKWMLVMVLLVVLTVSGFAFEKGTKSLGGAISLRSFDDDLISYTSLSLYPSFSYFVIDNLSLELSPEFGTFWVKDSDNNYSFGLGLGARYFINTFYGGARINLYKSGKKGDWMSGKELTLSAGRLFGIAKNIYLDLGLRYEIGLGKITHTGYSSENNNQKILTAQAGIAIYFK